ncbi:Lsr2 family DNA-binding protein [Rhodococcus opacus]|uniref:Lsr2 DNA-binding domain-containing protein n=1 Tax=Rhodococcus opacus TaxID=37919 RepID=A0A2S8IRG4_RHOOP|nr:histone-like nucleoid-structuring protein Lsr2 [Rhodococcus opacus]PQP17279.1 hypothetical protein C5613_34755 [Rhodococcus opacus]
MAVSPEGSAGSAKKTTKEIREWALGEGLEVSSRGRIPVEIEQAFHDAQAKTAQAKPVPVKKTAAKKPAAKKKTATPAPVKRVAASKAPAEKKIGATKTAPEKPTGTNAAMKKAVAEKPVAAKMPVKKAVGNIGPAKTTNKEIREWATAEGRQVSSRGRISVEIERAFHDAQAEPVA